MDGMTVLRSIGDRVDDPGAAALARGRRRLDVAMSDRRDRARTRWSTRRRLTVAGIAIVAIGGVATGAAAVSATTSQTLSVGTPPAYQHELVRCLTLRGWTATAPSSGIEAGVDVTYPAIAMFSANDDIDACRRSIAARHGVSVETVEGL